jgi:hypothetical protein
MREANVCSKLRDLELKVKEMDEKIKVFSNWQEIVLRHDYYKLALEVNKLVNSDDKELGMLGADLDTVKEFLAKVVYYSYKIVRMHKLLVSIPSVLRYNLRCGEDNILGVGIDEALKHIDAELYLLKDTYQKCKMYIEKYREASDSVLTLIDDLLDKKVKPDSDIYDMLEHIYNWVAEGFADISSLIYVDNEVYDMVKAEIEDLKRVLEEMKSGAKEEKKEEKKEGGK